MFTLSFTDMRNKMVLETELEGNKKESLLSDLALVLLHHITRHEVTPDGDFTMLVEDRDVMDTNMVGLTCIVPKSIFIMYDHLLKEYQKHDDASRLTCFRLRLFVAVMEAMARDTVVNYAAYVNGELSKQVGRRGIILDILKESPQVIAVYNASSVFYLKGYIEGLLERLTISHPMSPIHCIRFPC